MNGYRHYFKCYIIGYNHSRDASMGKLTSKLRRRQLDEKLGKLRGLSRLPRGYIHEIREALEMSSYQLAERMGVSQSTVMDIEASERKDTITLKSLERAAAALGCRLVYALVPDESLEQMVAEQSRLRAKQLSATIFRTMALEQQAANASDNEMLIEELAEDVLRKGKRELWKHDG
jgi:predicted DNA-binding mobile mystery protein A